MNYQILKLEKGATRDEIETSYARLRGQYREQMFLEGEAGNEGARKLTELDRAYAEIIDELDRSEAQSNFGSVLGDIDNLIRAGEYDKAQANLDNMSERTGEWHYLQSIIYYKRSWFAESRKQLELALNADPANEKYRTALTRLDGVMASPIKPGEQRTSRDNGQGAYNEEMGNMSDCSTCCLSLCLADCCCNMMSCCG